MVFRSFYCVGEGIIGQWHSTDTYTTILTVVYCGSSHISIYSLELCLCHIWKTWEDGQNWETLKRSELYLGDCLCWVSRLIIVIFFRGSQEGGCEWFYKEIEQNCIIYFSFIQWTNRDNLAVIHSNQSLKATTARWPILVHCILRKKLRQFVSMYLQYQSQRPS